jgi:hypothetical protein
MTQNTNKMPTTIKSPLDIKVVVDIAILARVLLVSKLLLANRLPNALVVVPGRAHLLGGLKDSGLGKKLLGGGGGDILVGYIAIEISLGGRHIIVS